MPMNQGARLACDETMRSLIPSEFSTGKYFCNPFLLLLPNMYKTSSCIHHRVAFWHQGVIHRFLKPSIIYTRTFIHKWIVDYIFLLPNNLRFMSEKSPNLRNSNRHTSSEYVHREVNYEYEKS
jgi:hypothetical protein